MNKPGKRSPGCELCSVRQRGSDGSVDATRSPRRSAIHLGMFQGFRVNNHQRLAHPCPDQTGSVELASCVFMAGKEAENCSLGGVYRASVNFYCDAVFEFSTLRPRLSCIFQ